MATTREDSLVRDNGLVKGLGLVDSTTLVMGSMIGSGVFIVAADISRQVQSPGLDHDLAGHRGPHPDRGLAPRMIGDVGVAAGRAS